jgi:hypothetical protein
MIIRPDQLASMDESLHARYYEELRQFFREKFPELVRRFEDPALLERIAQGDRHADSYGIQTDNGVVAYIGLSLAAGPAFHTDPNISGFLGMPGNDPDAKIEWLFKRVVEKLKALQNGEGKDSAPGA